MSTSWERSERFRLRLRGLVPETPEQPSPAPASLPPREHHRAIPAPSASRYRVIRRFRVNGQLQIEDIGAFTSVYPAYVLLARELSNAILLAPNGKQLSNNWQPVEDREP